MKNLKLFLGMTAVLLLVTLTAFKCGSENEPETSISEFNHNSIYTIFEINFGKDTTIAFDNVSIPLSLYDVIDSVWTDCSLTSFVSEEQQNTVKIHAFLNTNIQNETIRIKVSSSVCGALPFNGVSDIQDVESLINELKSASWEGYLSQQFPIEFGIPTKLGNSSYYINIAKAYPILYEQADKNLYKFIFILWKP